MADPNRTDGAPPTHINVEKNEQPAWLKWLAWIALALGLLALLLAISRCGRDETAAVVPAPVVGTDDVVAETPNAGTSAALVGTSALGGYLAGNEAAPQTFVFEQLNFDSGSSEVRATDATELNRVAATLKQYPNARIRIAGYADARGAADANARLGKARADSIKAALVAQGVEAARIDTMSGGENDPVDTNATSDGRFENRRTELVVTSR